MSSPHVFIQDEDRHWYFIPVTRRKQFMDLQEEQNHGVFMDEFDIFRIDGHPMWEPVMPIEEGESK